MPVVRSVAVVWSVAVSAARCATRTPSLFADLLFDLLA
jgi:hypothetical protein